MPDVMEQTPKAEQARKETAPRPRGRLGLVLAIVAVVIIGGGVWAYFHFHGKVSTDDAQVDAHITAIAPRIAGTVLQVLVQDNQEVKAGDVLVTIDPRDYEVRVDQAKAAVLQ